MDISEGNKLNLNVLDQISNYNFNKIENQIFKYKTILNNQHSLNRSLQSKNTTELKEDLINFLKIKKPLIDNQLKKLLSLKNEIISISLINKNLEEQDEELKEFQNSKEMKDLSKKLEDLSLIQDELNFFLQDMGIL